MGFDGIYNHHRWGVAKRHGFLTNTWETKKRHGDEHWGNNKKTCLTIGPWFSEPHVMHGSIFFPMFFG